MRLCGLDVNANSEVKRSSLALVIVVLRPRESRCLRSNELTAQNCRGKLSLFSRRKSPINCRGRPPGRGRDRFPNFGFRG